MVTVTEIIRIAYSLSQKFITLYYVKHSRQPYLSWPALKKFKISANLCVLCVSAVRFLR